MESLESTRELLDRARCGEDDALNRLMARYLPRFKRWATGRLPRWSRDLLDTDDLVQETLLRTLQNLDQFEFEREGALQAYIRQAVHNRIRNELRRASRHPGPGELDETMAARTVSPLERILGEESIERYEQALESLNDEERQLIVSRVELGFSYKDVAEAVGKSSPDAARMAVGRALTKLARRMAEAEKP